MKWRSRAHSSKLVFAYSPFHVLSKKVLSNSNGASSSPLIVRVYGIYTRDSRFAAMVIEYCSLGDLRNYLDSKMPLGSQQKMRILMDIAQVKHPSLCLL